MKLISYLMWKWYLFYTRTWELHFEQRHPADFEVCRDWKCRLIRPFDNWYLANDRWFRWNKIMNRKNA